MLRIPALVATVLALAGTAQAGEITGKVTTKKGNGGILVYVVKAEGKFAPSEKPVMMDQTKMAFVPYVLPVQVGSTVEFKNNDQVNHNVFTPDGEGYNLGTWGPGQSKTYKFEKPGVYTQLCSLHPEMEGYIAVLQNSYYAMTKDDGTFEIKKIPDGSYELRALGKGVKKKDRTKDFPVTVAGKAEANLDF